MPGNFKYYYSRFRSLPAREAGRAVLRKVGFELKARRLRARDARLSTYQQNTSLKDKSLIRYIKPIDAGLLESVSETVTALSNLYVSHKFDLLGSGRVEVKHGMGCRGMEGARYDMGGPVVADE